MLKKRYVRNIKANTSFYVSSIVLTLISLFLFFVMNIAGKAIGKFGEDFAASQKMEDANFQTYLPISDDDITELEKKYGVTIQRESYINIETNGVTAKVAAKNSKVDIYKVYDGRDVESDDEMVITKGYAVENKIKLNDSIKVGDKEYKVVGFFFRPDYLYMLKDNGDTYKNVKTFFLAGVTEDELTRLQAGDCQYLVRYNDNDDKDFRKEINDKFITRGYLPQSQNNRIVMVYMQTDMFILMSYIILCVMPLFAVIIISIIIKRKVKSEQKIIGTLSALGYSSKKLKLHYTGFGIIPGILGGGLSVLLSGLFAQTYAELCLADYEPMPIKGVMEVIPAILAIVVPTVMYGLTSYISVSKLLSKDTAVILSGNSDDGKKKLRKILVGNRKLFGKKLSFRFKFAAREIVGNLDRAFTVLLGIFVGAYIICLGFACLDTFKNGAANTADTIGSYKYQYVLNSIETEAPKEGEAILLASLENSKGKSVTVMGIDNDNPYVKLNDLEGNRVNLNDGYFFTSVSAEIFGFATGDVVTMYNPFSLEKIDVKVAGIVDNDMLTAVYTTADKAAELAGLPKNSYNAIMSDKKLDIDSKMISQVINMDDISKQFEQMNDQMGPIIYLIVFCGIIICFAAVYVVVNMLVTENKVNISMLKVLGYDEGRINKIVLRVNHIFLPIGIALSFPAIIGTLDYFFSTFADLMNMKIETHLSVSSYFLTIGFTSLCYFASILYVSRKVKRVDMVESLKDNRE